MKKYIIAPLHDVDSVVAHTVGEIWQPGVEHRFLEYKYEDKPFISIPLSPQHIIMADLGYSNSESNQNMVSKLEQLRNSGVIIDFYDQHNWPEEVRKRAFDKFIYSNEMSSGELMARNLVPENSVALYLGLLATKDDYNKPDKETSDLCDLVNSSFSKEKLFLELAGLKKPKLEFSFEAEKSLNQYRIERDYSFKILESSYELHDISLGKVATGLAPQILYMKPGHRKIRDDHPSINVICFYENVRNCTFITQREEQMQKLLSLFHGGGRGNEGGFDPGYIVTRENYYEIKNNIIKKLS